MKVILFYVGLAVAVIVLGLFSEVYQWLRRKLNKPKIGKEKLSLKLLKRDDIVCIKDNNLTFSHIAGKGKCIDILKPPLYDNKTMGGELAFSSNRLGYIYYHPSVLQHCDHIVGKYGLKWAESQEAVTRYKESCAIFSIVWGMKDLVWKKQRKLDKKDESLFYKLFQPAYEQLSETYEKAKKINNKPTPEDT